MVKQQGADFESRLILLELATEQHDENIKNLDDRVINHDKKWRAARPILNTLAHCKVERWVAIAITVLNLLLLLLK